MSLGIVTRPDREPEHLVIVESLGGGMQLKEHPLWGLLACLAILGVGWATGCAQVSPPVVETALAASARTPLVFVPGVTGVALRNTATDAFVWGKGKNLLRPHDRGYGLARSVAASHPGPQIVPGGVILDLKLFGLIRFNVYDQLVDLFLANGYRFGDLEQPLPTDDFFLFSYDWRQDNVASAARLAGQLETLRLVRGQEILRVNLICQSNGAHICRYFTKYGGLSLEDAESGHPRVPAGTTVDSLILVGASNGGSIRVLRELNRGRKYVDVIGRNYSSETLSTFISLYQDLPAYSTDLFVDGDGKPMAVDLYGVENWQRFQWSFYGPETSRQLGRADAPPWFGTAAERRSFLVDALGRARRFQDLLHRDVSDFGATRYDLITNMGNDTSSRAVLTQVKGVWQTSFADDKQVRGDPDLHSAVVVAGDGHATGASQRWLSPQEVRRLGDNTLEVAGTHRRIILQEATHRRILKILAESTSPDS